MASTSGWVTAINTVPCAVEGCKHHGQIGSHRVDVVTVVDFREWFDRVLLEKNTLGIDKVLMKLRRVLVVLRTIRDVAMDLGKLSLLDNENLDPMSIRPYVNNMIQLVDATVSNFPICVDYEFLTAFIRDNRQTADLLTINVHAISHTTSADSTIHGYLQKGVTQLQSALAKFPEFLSDVEDIVEEASPLLKRLFVLKDQFTGPIQTVLDGLRSLQSSARVQSEYAANKAKYTQMLEKCQDVYRAPVLLEVNRLAAEVAATERSLTEKLDCVIKSCQQVKNKKGRIQTTDAGNLKGDDIIKLNKLIGLFVKPELLPSLTMTAAEFSAGLALLSKGAEENVLGLAKKNQEKLVETCEAFNVNGFFADFEMWRTKSKTLEERKSSADFKAKLGAASKVDGAFNEVKKGFEKSIKEMNRIASVYHKVHQTFQHLKSQVASTCLQEFGIRLQLALPPDYLHLNMVDQSQHDVAANTLNMVDQSQHDVAATAASEKESDK